MDFIEEFDDVIELWGEGDLAHAIMESPEEDIYEFTETLALSTKYHFVQNEKGNDNFSFVANSSLSGGQFPCSYPECRKTKLDSLASFAALYADEVYIQNPFENIYLRGDAPIRETERLELAAGITNYFYLKPLIGKGIIKYATNNLPFCESHYKSIALPLSQSIQKKEDKLRDLLTKHLIEKCTVVFSFLESDPTTPFFEISGPEEFIEHGVMYFHGNKPVSNIFQNFLSKTTPYSLNMLEVQDNDILGLIVEPIINDLSAQEWHSEIRGTSYLCDNPMQMKIASKINGTRYSANSSAFENGLKHHLPAIYSQDLTTILDLRNKEEEAFFVYRDKLNKFMKETKAWEENEVRKIFRDQLLPEINIIDKKVKDWKSNTRESISQKLLFGTATASFGLYGGVLPTNIGEILAALGGASAVASSLMEYNKTFKEKQEARKNDFYFLWQAAK